MKKILFKLTTLFVLTAGLLLTSCDEEYYYDMTPPSPPTNLVTITGDNWVEIQWSHNPERDIAGYNVYYNYTYDGKYTLIGSTTEDYFIDYDAANGETYFYAVAAYDFDGNESELSYDYVKDTPRPEGYNRSVFDYFTSPNKAGYDFSNYTVLAYDSWDTDFFFENFEGTYYINVWEETDLQDMGSTYDIYDITEAQDGVDGIEKAKRIRLDLILLDISLPGVDGFRVLDMLKDDDALASIPVVALTARAMAGDREEILAYGFDGYVSKPISEKQIYDQIRRLLDERK